MKITLCAVEQPLYAAFKYHCSDVADVYKGSIFDIEADAYVSPANSFGFMDGGIDLLYMQHFREVVQGFLQQTIRKVCMGELLVGQATWVNVAGVETTLIVAPTMRVPMALPADTVNPFLATRSAIQAAMSLKVEHVAFPGMGTGCGKVPPQTAAKQMRAGIEEGLHGVEFPKTWLEAKQRHEALTK